MRAQEHEGRRLLEAKCSAAEAPFQAGGVPRVSYQEIAGRKGETIECAGRWHRGIEIIPSAEVLHGREGRSAKDADHSTGSNRTRSPAASRLGTLRLGSNSTASVRPIRC